MTKAELVAACMKLRRPGDTMLPYTKRGLEIRLSALQGRESADAEAAGRAAHERAVSETDSGGIA